MKPEKPKTHWARPLLRPAPLTAALVLAINDHVLKGSGWLPGSITGKLSDFAGVFLLPFVLVTCALLIQRAANLSISNRLLSLTSVSLTGVGFAALKLSPTVNALANKWWGQVIADPTDVIALLVLPLSFIGLQHATRYERARHSPTRRPWIAYGALFATLWACVATSAVQRTKSIERAYPTWRVTRNTSIEVACVNARAWVAKSGKQGVGLTIALTNQCKSPTRVTISPGPFDLHERTDRTKSVRSEATIRVQPRPSITLATGATEHVYVSYAFDNEAAWNANLRAATTIMTLTRAPDSPSSETVPFELGLVHTRDSPHREVNHIPGRANPNESHPGEYQ